ncbi:MAG: NTP transferase domain-containing protein, partial [Leptospiraceae bacterium]|nr:NTP transferase domain-containing protein [Leptospiraceae bacterium]
MRAMILAAGLGTRMEELTRDCPKPMLPLLEVPLIAHTLLLLYKHGCSFAAINTHYLGEQ